MPTSKCQLYKFLECAYSNKWLSKNFLLANLERQFDKIIHDQSAGHSEKSVTDLEYLYQRFLEGNIDTRMILQEHFAELSNKFQVSITPMLIQNRMRRLLGTNNFSETQLYHDYAAGTESKLVREDQPKLMKMAVLDYFENLKRQNLDHIPNTD